jgi:fumarylacetoacetase
VTDSWVPGTDGSPHGPQTLPYGVFVHGRREPAIGVRIGDDVLDLAQVEESGRLDTGGAFLAPTLNRFMALGRAEWDRVRARVVELLTDEFYQAGLTRMLVPLADCRMRLPFEVADYVDFYSFEQHATNVGRLFRPGQPPLTPNWRHLPIGYHGRSGTVVVSGTDVVRPSGQRKPPDAEAPTYGPSGRLDIEAEVGFVVGAGSTLGEPVSPAEFADHVFGVVLVNDWSARDLQAWEYVPLGPFLGKSFATSISAWVLPLAALEAARVPAPAQDPPVLDYLAEADRFNYDLSLEVVWNGELVSRPPFAAMYWTPAQQLAHMTAGGASLRTGDLFASGTVSGPERDQVGSFLELTWGGAEPVKLADGSPRTFLADGDTVTITATAPGPEGSAVAVGEVTGTIRPAVTPAAL